MPYDYVTWYSLLFVLTPTRFLHFRKYLILRLFHRVLEKLDLIQRVPIEGAVLFELATVSQKVLFKIYCHGMCFRASSVFVLSILV